MKLFVVDASVVVKWFIPEEHSDVAELLLDENFELAVPRLFFSEFGNILWKKFSRGEIGQAEVLDAAVQLRAAELEPMPDELLLDAAIALACGLNHLVYDCLYLALADSLETAVVTANQKFANKVADPARIVFVADFLKA
jgi:predicted nucleic acid-binding protein